MKNGYNMKCCANCFDDKILCETIFPNLSQEIGICSFCETENILIVEPAKLRDYFDQLKEIYRENDK